MTRILSCVVLTSVALSAGNAARAADVLISSKVAVVKAGKLAKVVSQSKQQPGETPFGLPAPGSSEDPTIGGAVLQVFDTNSGGAGSVSFDLDAWGWVGLGNPAGSKGYKYKGKNDVTDPDPKGTCRIVLLKEKVVKAVCKGPAVDLTPPVAGAAGMVLGVPAGSAALRYCARFGGTVAKNDAKVFKRKDAPPPSECPSICAGFEFADACWFPGTALGQSCDQTCAVHELVYDDATRTVAGSDGTGENCAALLSGLEFPAPFGGSFEDCGVGGVGCASAPIEFVSARCISPPTTGDAAAANIVRICACQ